MTVAVHLFVAYDLWIYADGPNPVLYFRQLGCEDRGSFGLAIKTTKIEVIIV